MKKLLYCAAALAAVFFAGSCQRENLEPVANGGVTYTITLPEIVQTKGEIGYAEYDLYLEVYKTVVAAELEKATLLFEKKEVITADMNGKISVGLDLLNDQDYTILFWANKKKGEGDQAWFITDDLRNVELLPSASNNDDRDAYCAMDQIVNHNGAIAKTVELKRPFAQVNIATLVKEVGYNITPKTSYVKFTNIPVAYNVFTGKPVGENKVVEYGVENNEHVYTTIPADSITVNGVDYKYVAMNYVLVPEGNIDVYYEIVTDNGTVKNTVNNVPVKPNYRTNIVGNLLTSNATYTVEIKPGFHTPAVDVTIPTGDEIVELEDGSVIVATTVAFQNAIQNAKDGDVVRVAGPVVLPASMFNANSGTLTIEGMTEEAEVSFKSKAGAADGGLNCYADEMDLVFRNIKVVSPNTGSAYSGGFGRAKSVTFVNCEYFGQYRANSAYTHFIDCTIDPQTSYIYTDYADVDFTGCTFNCSEGKGIQVYNDGNNTETVVNVTDCAFAAAKHGATWDGKPVTAIDINSNGEKFTVNISNSTATGFPEGLVTSESLFNIKGGAENVTVYVDGAKWLGVDSWENDGNLVVYTAAALQNALNNAAGTATIQLGADIEGNVTVIQKQGVKITIDGNGKKYVGFIKVHSNSNHYADAALTIKKVNFESSVASTNFIEALENGSERYSTNITVQDCTFTATEEGVNTSVGVQIKASKNAKVLNCTATDMHSLIQAQSCDETVVVNGCTINGKNGVAFKQVKAATVEGTTITALEYGIRFDGNTDNYGIVVKDNTVEAKQPFIVRKMTGKNNTITLEGTNTFTTGEDFQIVITNGSDDAEYAKPTGTYTLNGAEGYSVYDGKPVAKVGATEYDSMSKAIDAWTNNTTLTLMADVTLSDVVKLKSTEHHTLDLGTYTLTAASGNHAIEVTCNGRSNASYALTVNADATNPGGITATGKSCIYYKKSDSTKDRPIILINNGVFTGSYSINSTSNGNTNCPQIWINGGVFNSYMNLTKNMLKVSGGTFHAAINCTGDSSAYRQISGGRFKSWQFMTADADSKFWVGTAKATYDVGVYVDDEGYLVVGGPVITEFGDKFAAKATNPTKWSSYLKYSSAAANGLYYTNAEAAIAKHGEANVVLK